MKASIWLRSRLFTGLKAANQNVRRGRTKAPKRKVLTTHRADAPIQVWCWDITWLPSTVKGRFFLLVHGQGCLQP